MKPVLGGSVIKKMLFDIDPVGFIFSSNLAEIKSIFLPSGIDKLRYQLTVRANFTD